MWRVFVVFLLCNTVVSASCPKDCQCSAHTPRCAAGVSLTLDGCGCCKVCAQQLFEDCSRIQPCDHTKGLECNFGGRHSSAKGICRAKSDGRTCEYNRKMYQNGEIFRPNCKHQCTCMDGAVGCVSLCPHQLMLHKPGCAQPRRIKVPGRCCEQLVCPEDAKTENSADRKLKKKHDKGKMFEDELTKESELSAVWRKESKSLPAFRIHPLGHVLVREVHCVSQTTAWSPCSKSCGTGLSTRVTNNNPQCKLVKETRICEVRLCNQIASKKDQTCNHTEKSRRPTRLSYAGCFSLKKFQLKHCGSCTNGQCCRPHQTQTTPVQFRCRNGDIMSRMVMIIKSCKCGLNCSGSNKTSIKRLL